MQKPKGKDMNLYLIIPFIGVCLLGVYAYFDAWHNKKVKDKQLEDEVTDLINKLKRKE